jgi:hypothetical protein
MQIAIPLFDDLTALERAGRRAGSGSPEKAPVAAVALVRAAVAQRERRASARVTA